MSRLSTHKLSGFKRAKTREKNSLLFKMFRINLYTNISMTKVCYLRRKSSFKKVTNQNMWSLKATQESELRFFKILNRIAKILSSVQMEHTFLQPTSCKTLTSVQMESTFHKPTSCINHEMLPLCLILNLISPKIKLKLIMSLRLRSIKAMFLNHSSDLHW